MSHFDRNYAATQAFQTGRTAVVDQGLRAHLIRVYNYMAGGVALTGAVAWFTFQSAVVTDATGKIVALTPFGQTLFGSPLMWLFVLAPLGLVFLLSFRIGHLQVRTAKTLFFLYAASLGLSLASIFMAYTEASIAHVFFISAAASKSRWHGLFYDDGALRTYHREPREHLSEIERSRLDAFNFRRSDFCRTYRLGYAKNQGDL